MDLNVLIPKKNASRSPKPGFGSEYWKDFWEDFSDSANYTRKITGFKTVISEVSQEDIQQDKKLYLEVKLENEAKSKSLRPGLIWKNSGLEVVSSQDRLTYTLSGKKRDFESFEKMITESSFDLAKNGSGYKKQLSRELYALSSLSGKNKTIENRIDARINDFLKSNSEELVECVIDIYPEYQLADYDNLFTALGQYVAEGRLEKREPELFVVNLSFRAKLLRKEIEHILTDIQFNFVKEIFVSPIVATQRSISNLPIDEVKIEKPESDQIIGIFDSGINNPLVSPLVSLTENCLLNGSSADANHGTFVASRILYGDGLEGEIKNKRVYPLCSLADFRVLGDDPESTDGTQVLDNLMVSIRKMVDKYPDINIYNLSINMLNSVTTGQGEITEFTQLIDIISREKDVLFVCSAGNHQEYTSGYAEAFSEDNQFSDIAAPADSLNGISVGAISEEVNENCICSQQGYPSPFSRKGGIRQNWKKPELVASGGNIEIDPSNQYSPDFRQNCSNKLGVVGLNQSGLGRDNGTSFSTPIITREAALLYDYIKHSNINEIIDITGNRSNLMKALLVHSTNLVTQTPISDVNVQKAYGFGKPDFSKLFEDEDNKVSMLYCDKIDMLNKKHKLRFELPSILLGKNVEFIFTLVFNPPVNRNARGFYKLANVSGSLRLLIPQVDSSGKPVEPDTKDIKPSKWNWTNYKNEDFNITNFRARKRKLDSLAVEALISLSENEELDKKYFGRGEEFSQPYALALTIRSLDSETIPLLRLMNESNQFKELIDVRAQVQIESN